jgi:hypothetical protein
MRVIARNVRSKREVELAENPLGSLPAHMRTWKETKALFRVLDEPDVTCPALMQPHLHQSREQANASAVVLLVQETTDLDLSHRRRHPSAAWGTVATSEDGAFSCTQCWPCVRRPERCSARRTAGMGSGDLGSHDHASAKPGSAWTALSIGGSSRTITTISQVAVVSSNDKGLVVMV